MLLPSLEILDAAQHAIDYRHRFAAERVRLNAKGGLCHFKALRNESSNGIRGEIVGGRFGSGCRSLARNPRFSFRFVGLRHAAQTSENPFLKQGGGRIIRTLVCTKSGTWLVNSP